MLVECELVKLIVRKALSGAFPYIAIRIIEVTN